MKGLGRILSRYAISAAGVGLFLLLLNAGFLLAFTIQAGQSAPLAEDRIRLIASGITPGPDGGFQVADAARRALDERYAWAMLLDEAGEVIWSDRLPADFSQHYTASQIAGFSRWYLKDYPVYVWSDDDGLLILGSPVDSEWKYSVTMSTQIMENALRWLPAALLLNIAAALLLALLLGWRLFGAVRPVAQAIDQLAAGEAIALPEHGLLAALSANLNRASRLLSQQQALLDKRDRARTQWIAGVSHDIRTPLSIVMASAAQLADDPQLPAAAQLKAQRLLQQSQRMSQLISDLNLASKLEYQMQPLRPAPYRPAALVRTAAAEALNETQRAIDLTLDVPAEAEALQLTGDAALLGRALGNLLRNSLSHAPDPLSITMTLTQQASICAITISDNGPGLAPEVLARLRDPLPQELPTHGLGLILVQQILQAHQGSVRFQNLKPQGLAVTLYLPIP